MIVREVFAKSILSKSAIQDYALNAYVGCPHNCRYCYARFMKRFTGHAEPWGSFVDVKVNAPELLAREVLRKKKGRGFPAGCSEVRGHRLPAVPSNSPRRPDGRGKSLQSSRRRRRPVGPVFGGPAHSTEIWLDLLKKLPSSSLLPPIPFAIAATA